MEYTKYAAVGHFKCHRTLDGKKYPVVIVGRKEYMLDVQEMTVWSSLAWRILSRSQIAETYLKLTRGLSFTSRRTLDDCIDRLVTRGLVAEGRDMGTVVFPEADLKIFLTASPEARAERRYKERVARGEDADLADILAQVNRRDEIDSSREVAPLRQADDAVFLDTTDLAYEQVVERILAFAAKAAANREKSPQVA